MSCNLLISSLTQLSAGADARVLTQNLITVLKLASLSTAKKSDISLATRSGVEAVKFEHNAVSRGAKKNALLDVCERLNWY